MSFREVCESKNSEEYLIYSYIHKGKPRKKYRRTDKWQCFMKWNLEALMTMFML